MNPIILQMIITALSGAQDWDAHKFTEFCHDVEPLIDKPEVSYYLFCPIYDKYIHHLDKVEKVVDEIEK